MKGHDIMKYNLITLKMFLTVVRTGSIAQASEVENVAASAISKRISDLEDQIGGQGQPSPSRCERKDCS